MSFFDFLPDVLSDVLPTALDFELPGAGSILSAGASLLGGMNANNANASISSANNAFNADQAAINRQFQSDQAGITRDWSAGQAQNQMDFQERMADTQWQRTVTDLTRAGLNPMLAYMKGPNASPSGAMGSAATPSGATASSSGNPTMRDILTPAITTAAGISELNSKLEKMDAEIGEIKARTTTERGRPALLAAQTGLADNQALLAVSSANVAEWSAQKIANEIPRITAEVANIKADTENKYIQWQVTQSIADLNAIQKKLLEHEIPLKDAQTDLQRVLAKLATLDVPKATNEAAAQSSWWKQHISPYLPDIGGATSAFGRFAK